ncbi:hypothetical protein EE612_053053, partial [Oryza sativa]
AASPPSPPPPPLADGVVLDSSATRLLHLLVFLLPPSPLPLLAASFPASSATSQIHPHLRSPLPSSTTPWVSKKDKQKVNFFNLTGTLSRQSTCKWPRRAASLQPPVPATKRTISPKIDTMSWIAKPRAKAKARLPLKRGRTSLQGGSISEKASHGILLSSLNKAFWITRSFLCLLAPK